jgi:hypothetical protein
MERFELNVDVAHCCTIGEFFEMLERHGARIEHFVANGPGGGNPNFDLVFPTDDNRTKFKKEYDPDGIVFG